MSARYYERVGHIENILLIQNLVIDIQTLRKACLYGIPDKFRPLCWRLFLDYLPRERQNWGHILQKQREYYENLVENLTIHPSSSALASSTASAEQNFVVQEDVDDHPLAISSPLKYSHADDNGCGGPSRDADLPINRNSEWATYFKDNEVLMQIDKDVRRLRPEMGFFQRNTMYPKRWSKHANLVKRIREVLGFSVADGTTGGGVCTNSAVSTFSHDSNDNGNGGEKNEGEMHWHVVERILFIYSKLNPGIKYVQGMNEIVGPIYFVFASDADEQWAEHAEADTFYCFQNLMSEIKDNFIKTLDSSDCGIEAVLNRFYDRFREMDPELYGYLVERQNIKSQFYAFRWISLLLSQEFSLPDLIEIWDNVFSSKNRVESVEFVCLAMIEGIRGELIRGDFGNNVRMLQNYPETDISTLITRAMELSGRAVSGNANGDTDSLSSSWSSGGGRALGQKVSARGLQLKSKISALLSNTQKSMSKFYANNSTLSD